MIYANGKGYEGQEVQISKFLAGASLGNLGGFENVICSYSNLKQTENKMQFECVQGFELTEIKKFGLAFKDETCVGKGMGVDVETIDYCSPKDAMVE